MKKRILSKSFLLLIILFIGGCIGFSKKQGITDFQYERDSEQVLKIFYDDWDWLFPGLDYSPEYILENKAPGKELHQAKYRGKLQIKVLRKDGAVAGFAAFYKKNFYQGWVQFIAVAREFRRKGYGRKLAIESVLSLFEDHNCKSVLIYTRQDNKKARSLYESLGFQEVDRDSNGFGITYFVTKKSFKG